DPILIDPLASLVTPAPITNDTLWSDTHAILDAAGYVPGIGGVATAIDAGFYAAQGQFSNALSTGASAAFNFFGGKALKWLWKKAGPKGLTALAAVAGSGSPANPWANMTGRTFRRWIESLETQAAQTAGAGR